MSYTIEILSDVKACDKILIALDRAITTSLKMLSVAPSSLSLLLTDNERIRQLNRDYRGIDSPTDVLSFEASIELPDAIDQELYLGDIAIAVPYAQLQAERSGHPLVAELQLLAIHGVLHLLGYDHLNQDERTEMWSLQKEILGEIGLNNIAPTE